MSGIRYHPHVIALQLARTYRRRMRSFLDVILVMDDGRVRAHQAALMAVSPLLRAIMGETEHGIALDKDGNDDTITVLQLAGFKVKVVEHMLELIHTGQTGGMSKPEVMSLATLTNALELVPMQLVMNEFVPGRDDLDDIDEQEEAILSMPDTLVRHTQADYTVEQMMGMDIPTSKSKLSNEANVLRALTKKPAVITKKDDAAGGSRLAQNIISDLPEDSRPRWQDNFDETVKKKPKICYICQSVLTTLQTLMEHLRNHKRDSGPYACEVCKLSLRDGLAMHIHMKRHLGKEMEEIQLRMAKERQAAREKQEIRMKLIQRNMNMGEEDEGSDVDDDDLEDEFSDFSDDQRGDATGSDDDDDDSDAVYDRIEKTLEGMMEDPLEPPQLKVRTTATSPKKRKIREEKPGPKPKRGRGRPRMIDTSKRSVKRKSSIVSTVESGYCSLCDVTVAKPQYLAQHNRTQMHVRNEQRSSQQKPKGRKKEVEEPAKPEKEPEKKEEEKSSKDIDIGYIEISEFESVGGKEVGQVVTEEEQE